MKKITVFLMILINLLTVSCSKQKDLGEEYINGVDSQYMFTNTDDDKYICRGENGYYFINGIYLYYCDFDTMESVPVCNKPNCLHDKELDSSKKHNCNAFLLTGFNQLVTIYEKSIYCYIEEDWLKDTMQPELIKISLDGSKRETVCTLEPNIRSMVLHRGKLYYSVSSPSFEGGDEEKGMYTYALKELDISNSKSKPKVLAGGKLVDGYIANISAVGNNITFCEYGFDENNDRSITNKYVYNIKNEEKHKIGDDLDKNRVNRLTISNKELLFSPQFWNGTEYLTSDKIYSYNLESNKSKVLFHKSWKEDFFYSDDKYIYFDNTKLFDWEDELDENYKRMITIYNKQGEKVDTVDVSEIPDVFLFNRGDDKYLFVKYETEDGAYIKYIDKKDIGSGDIHLKTLFELDREFLDNSVTK